MSVITKDTIQPASGQALTIKDEGGTASITVATNGEATFAENIIIGTAGKGIDFSLAQSNASGTTDEILSGYERGTFSPTMDRDTSGTYTPHANDRGNYIRIGDLVYLNGYLRGTFSGGSGGYRIAGTSQGNLPFTVSIGTYAFVQSISTSSNLGVSSVNTSGIYCGTLVSSNQYGFFCVYYTTD